MSKQKTKGDRFERELAAHISNKTGLTCERAPLSGGGAIGVLAGGADLIGTPGLHVEAKRTERADFPGWLRQAEAALTKNGAPERPIVINRRNLMATGESYALLRLDHFLDFYHAWLLHHGHIKGAEVDHVVE